MVWQFFVMSFQGGIFSWGIWFLLDGESADIYRRNRVVKYIFRVGIAWLALMEAPDDDLEGLVACLKGLGGRELW